MFINIVIDEVECVQDLEGGKLHGPWDSYSSSVSFQFHVNIYPCENGQLEERISPIIAIIIEVNL